MYSIEKQIDEAIDYHFVNLLLAGLSWTMHRLGENWSDVGHVNSSKLYVSTSKYDYVCQVMPPYSWKAFPKESTAEAHEAV